MVFLQSAVGWKAPRILEPLFLPVPKAVNLEPAKEVPAVREIPPNPPKVPSLWPLKKNRFI